MKRNGFTLIELLAVIVVIGLLAVLITPSVISASKKAKESSYNILIKNIVTASENYYRECEYGDLSDESKYGVYHCTISNGKYIVIELGTLANTGFLNVSDVDKSSGKKIVKDPRNDNDLSKCKIRITKNKEVVTDGGITRDKISYSLENTTLNGICPSTYQ